MSGVVGDVAAHRLGELARGIGNWGRDASATRWVKIFASTCRKKAATCPAATRWSGLRTSVGTLRDDVDRLAARTATPRRQLMARTRTVLRMLTIQRVLVKYSLDDIIKETHLLRPLRFLFYLAPRRRDRSAPIGERIRLALEELGPIFVKFGQAISTRRDLLPADIADELAKLQDAVPPFPASVASGDSERGVRKRC